MAHRLRETACCLALSAAALTVPAPLAALLTGFGGALGVVGEVAAAFVAALLAGFGGALGVVGEVTLVLGHGKSLPISVR